MMNRFNLGFYSHITFRIMYTTGTAVCVCVCVCVYKCFSPGPDARALTQFRSQSCETAKMATH